MDKLEIGKEINEYDRKSINRILNGEGTWFGAHLLRLINKADAENRRILKQVYPTQVEVVEGYYKNQSRGIRSNFSIIYNTTELLLIKDRANEDKSLMSITNDAEEVVEYLLKEGILSKGKVLYYIDTMGCVEILDHNGTKFTGFKVGYKDINEFNIHNMR